MRYLHPVAFVPNELITDPKLHYTTKRVAAVLLHVAGRAGRAVQISFSDLAQMASCSTTTAQRAVRELVAEQYIEKRKCYRFSADTGHLIYDTSSYLWIRRRHGYTMVRRELLDLAVSPAAYCVLLYLYRCAGASGRAFPSLRRIAGRLIEQVTAGMDMAKSTVCAALTALRRCQAVARHMCRTQKNFFAANSYYLTDMVIPKSQSISSFQGSPKFNKPNIINQLTRDYTNRRKKERRIAEGLSEIWMACAAVPDYWFDGIGVRVSSDGEQLLTA